MAERSSKATENGHSTSSSSSSPQPPQDQPKPPCKRQSKRHTVVNKVTVCNIARLCGSSSSKCGYCHGERASVLGDSATPDSSSHSFGVYFDRLQVADYQHLINRGWRRSGKHLYLPILSKSCCPAIPIRLNTLEFTMSKSQRKVWRAVHGEGINNNNNNNNNNLGSSSFSNKPPASKVRKLSAASLQHTDDAQRRAEDYVSSNATLLSTLQTALEEAVRCAIQNYEPLFDSSSLDKLAKFKVRKGEKNSGKLGSSSTNSDNSLSNVQQFKVVLFSTVCSALVGQVRGRQAKKQQDDDLATSIPLPTPFELATQVSESWHDPVLAEWSIGPMSALESGHILLPICFSMESISTTPIHTKRLLDNHNHNTKPQFITVRSIPSTISARQPEVHELYAKYQKVIHGDENPFEDDLTEQKDEDENGGANNSTEHPDNQEVRKKKIEKAFKSFERFLVENPMPHVHKEYETNENGCFDVDQEVRVEH